MKSYISVILTMLFCSTSFAQVNYTGTGISSENFVTKPVAIEADTNAFNSNLFPNPLREKLTIAWNYFNITLNLSIFDTGGNLIFSRSVSNNSTISIKQLKEGLHYYKLTDGPYLRKSGKLMIRH